MVLSKKVLRKKIKAILKGINRIPNTFCCHELMRKIHQELLKEGIRSEVIDGIALYHYLGFMREASFGNCEIFCKTDEFQQVLDSGISALESARKCPKEEEREWRLGIYHSWLIVPEQMYLVDYHVSICFHDVNNLSIRHFPVLQNLIISRLLRIIDLEEIPKRGEAIEVDYVIYEDVGIQEGNSIVYPEGISFPLNM